MALFGLAPHATGLAWGVLGGLAFVGFMGPLLQTARLGLRPLSAGARSPPLGRGLHRRSADRPHRRWVALLAAGLVGFSRRDVASA